VIINTEKSTTLLVALYWDICLQQISEKRKGLKIKKDRRISECTCEAKIFARFIPVAKSCSEIRNLLFHLIIA
jgi:hypothetical protein